MTDENLRAALLSLASERRQKADNLVSPEWHETYGNMPVLRQNQYGMALADAVVADEIVELLGLDPRSLWPQFRLPEPLPEAERARLRWSDGVER